MKWDDASIAGFARRAGWAGGGDVATAVAVALATSGGDDAYEYQPIFGPAHHWVGMWGIDILAHPEFDAGLLRDPVYCADAAHSLWQITGVGWTWSQPFTTGAYKRYAAEGVAASNAPSPAQYGFGVDPGLTDPSELAGVSAGGRSSVGSLETVVRSLGN